MTTLSIYKPKDRIESIRPGFVGPVGDVLVTARLKHSNPELPLRYEQAFAGSNAKRIGANIQDGDHRGYINGGLQARVKGNNWAHDRSFKTAIGWHYQDLRAPDTSITSVLQASPQAMWQNKVARTYDAFRTGQKFLPLPGGFGPDGGLPRGGSTPLYAEVDPLGGSDEPTEFINSVVGPSDDEPQGKRFK